MGGGGIKNCVLMVEFQFHKIQNSTDLDHTQKGGAAEKKELQSGKRKLLGMINIFIILVAVMTSSVYVMCVCVCIYKNLS